MGVGFPYVNVQYVWYRDKPWTGCLYFEIGKFGVYCVLGRSAKRTVRYVADPNNW